jgi:hypothetical protein
MPQPPSPVHNFKVLLAHTPQRQCSDHNPRRRRAHGVRTFSRMLHRTRPTSHALLFHRRPALAYPPLINTHSSRRDRLVACHALHDETEPCLNFVTSNCPFYYFGLIGEKGRRIGFHGGAGAHMPPCAFCWPQRRILRILVTRSRKEKGFRATVDYVSTKFLRSRPSDPERPQDELRLFEKRISKLGIPRDGQNFIRMGARLPPVV